MFYRKFFWDFVGGTLRDPGGMQYVFAALRILLELTSCLFRPPSSAAFFTNIIVKAPVVQIITFLLGLLLVAMDYPVPQLKQLAIHRSLVLRCVLLMVQSVLTILFYQVSLRPFN
jgi:hypothetical protein